MTLSALGPQGIQVLAPQTQGRVADLFTATQEELKPLSEDQREAVSPSRAKLAVDEVHGLNTLKSNKIPSLSQPQC